MTLLSDTDRIAIQDNLDTLRLGLAEVELTVHVESDFSDWVRHMEGAPNITAVSPSFDPRFSYLHPGNSFWISIRQTSGAIAACSCHRLFIVSDVRDLIASHRIFFDRMPVLEFRPVPIVIPSDTPKICGRVAYGGGYWVHPDFRGAGLTGIVPRISRFLSLRHFEPDWNIALLQNTVKRRTMARDGFGVAHQIPCIEGYYPPNQREASYQLAFMSAREMLDQANLERSRPPPALDIQARMQLPHTKAAPVALSNGVQR